MPARRLLLAFPLSLLLTAAAPAQLPQSKQVRGTGIDVQFENLRSNRGILRLCLSRNPAHYPDCSGDPQARQVNVPAARGYFRCAGLRRAPTP
jgi:hypothetical protein